MKQLTRFALAMGLFLPVAGLLSGCGEAPNKEKNVAAQNTREDAATEAPSAPQSPEPEELSKDDGLDAPGGSRARPVAPSMATDDEPAMSSPESTAKSAEPPAGAPPEPPSTVAEATPPEAEPPAPSAAGATPDANVGDKPGEPAVGGIGASRGLGAPTTGQGSGSGGASTAQPAPPPPPPAPSAATEAKPKEPTFDVVPVYYGTDRAVEADPERLKYGAERGHKLALGRALVTVPTAHKVPSIERPWVVEIPYFKVKVYAEKEDPAKHFTLQEVKALTKDELIALVKERLAKSATFKDHAIVFVHGFNTSFDYALFRTAQIAYDLKFDGAPFVYSWPSGGKVASYTYDRGSAEQAEPHLAEFLDLVVKESGAKSISLIAHSMGNEVLLRVLERMRPQAPQGVEISQVILAAPDVDRDKFENIARQIKDFAKGVTLYAASNDRALRYSASFWGGVPRAGDVPAQGPLIVPGVDTIDVSAVSTDSLGLNHSGYAENNALLNDIKLLIQTGQRPPDKREPTLQAVTTERGPYWRYPPVK